MSSSFWDDRYRDQAFAYGREPNDFLREQAHHIPPGRVLCLAEGEGRNAVYLASLGHQVTAVDFSAEGLKKAGQLAAERGVRLELVQADLAEYQPAPGAFSGVVAIWAHLPPSVRRAVHGRVAEALSPGGCFLLEAYHPRQIALGTGGPKDPSMMMTAEGLRGELTGLEIVLAREVEREVHEGAYHEGPSATVQVLARRSP